MRKVYEDAPAVESMGLAFIGYYNALGIYRRIAREALERAGIDDPQPDGWYRRQILLDVLREVERRGDPSTLFQVGKELANFTPLPPEMTTFERIIENSSTIYPQFQRNLPAYDFIRVERDGAAWLYVYHTPWPSQVIRGYLWQMLRRFYPDAQLRMELVQGAEDDFERTFRLSWTS
jgi:hypothetical protein